MAISTVPDPSGSGRVDMSTSPVAAARAVVVTGAWVESKHDIYLIRGSVGAQALFLPIRRRIKKKEKRKKRKKPGAYDTIKIVQDGQRKQGQMMMYMVYSAGHLCTGGHML